jgi:hypothetical protein
LLHGNGVDEDFEIRNPVVCSARLDGKVRTYIYEGWHLSLLKCRV